MIERSPPSQSRRARPGKLAASVIEPLAFARLPKNPYAAAQLQQQLSAARTTRAAAVAQPWHPCAEPSWCKGEPAMTSRSTLGSRRRRQAGASAKAPCDSCCKWSSQHSRSPSSTLSSRGLPFRHSPSASLLPPHGNPRLGPGRPHASRAGARQTACVLQMGKVMGERAQPITSPVRPVACI